MAGMVDGVSKLWIVEAAHGRGLSIHGHPSAIEAACYIARNAIVIETGQLDFGQLQASAMHAIASAIAAEASAIEQRLAFDRGEFPDLPADLFNPERMPSRNSEDGQAIHPDIFRREWYAEDPANGDALVISERLRAAGWETTSTEIPPELIEDGDGVPLQGDDYYRAVVAWQPSQPHGDGWQLVAVYDSEDGPCATFVRRLR